MPLLVSKRELLLLTTGQTDMIVRAHRGPVYGRGAKVPIVIDKSNPAGLSVQIVATATTDFSALTDRDAQLAGFRDLEDFTTHWRNAIYGPDGLYPKSAPSLKGGTIQVVRYRMRAAEFKQLRVRLHA